MVINLSSIPQNLVLISSYILISNLKSFNFLIDDHNVLNIYTVDFSIIILNPELATGQAWIKFFLEFPVLFLGHPIMDPETGCDLPSTGQKARLLIGTACWFCYSIDQPLTCTLHPIDVFWLLYWKKINTTFQLCLNLKSVKKNLFQNTCSREGHGSKILNRYIVKFVQAFQTIQKFWVSEGFKESQPNLRTWMKGLGSRNT